MAVVHCAFSWFHPVGEGHRCPAHAHECTEIVFSLRSEGVLQQRGRSYAYGDQSVFVYQPGASHWVANRRAGDHCCIGVVGCQADRLLEGVWPVDGSLAGRFHDIIETLHGEHGAGGRQSRLDLLSGLVICDLLDRQPARCNEGLSRAQRIRQIIEDRLTEPVLLEKLAREIHVSRDYLRQLFRNEFGESITRYVMRRRVEFASRLLLNSRDSVKEVAAQAGFSSEFYFSRVFRRFMGRPPSLWLEARRSGRVTPK